MRDGLGEEAGELAELYLAWMRLVVAASVERGDRPHQDDTERRRFQDVLLPPHVRQNGRRNGRLRLSSFSRMSNVSP
jgi:hypothetical protein